MLRVHILVVWCVCVYKHMLCCLTAYTCNNHSKPSWRFVLPLVFVNLLHICRLGYKNLAVWAYNNSLCCFNMKPKLHYVVHVQQLLKQGASLPEGVYSMNPMGWATPMDEDWIGRLSRISRKTHGLTVSLSTTRRYLIYARRHWRSVKKILKRKRR